MKYNSLCHKTERQNIIGVAMMKYGVTTAKQIFEVLADKDFESANHVSSYLRCMEDKGMIAKVSRGEYQLLDAFHNATTINGGHGNPKFISMQKLKENGVLGNSREEFVAETPLPVKRPYASYVSFCKRRGLVEEPKSEFKDNFVNLL